MYLFGGEGALTFPDLWDLGVEIPRGAACNLTMFRDDQAMTVDALAAHGPFHMSDTQPWTWGDTGPLHVTMP